MLGGDLALDRRQRFVELELGAIEQLVGAFGGADVVGAEAGAAQSHQVQAVAVDVESRVEEISQRGCRPGGGDVSAIQIGTAVLALR